MIERRKYLEMCQRNSVEPNSVTVSYNGVRYFPFGYEMRFDEKGNTKNIAVIKSMKANSVIYARLDSISE